jgi:hypothetical protein
MRDIKQYNTMVMKEKQQFKKCELQHWIHLINLNKYNAISLEHPYFTQISLSWAI